MFVNATATAVHRYVNNLTEEMRVQGFNAEVTRLEQAEKYGPWTLHLTVTSRRDQDTACVFEMDIDPADGDGMFADIPRLDFDFANTNVANRRERRAQVREQLSCALSGCEIDDDFYGYGYGYNYMMVSDAMVTVMLGLAVTC